MTMPPPVRVRQPFQDICTGWGYDDRDHLAARCEVLSDWWRKNFPLTPAEHRIAHAMLLRLIDLGDFDLPVRH